MKLITIDNFQTPSYTYLISHAHNDHIKGYRRYKNGIILGSHITIEVLKLYMDKVLDIFVKKLSVENEYDIVNGRCNIKLRAFDANHCPGALMFCFKTPNKNILYTGDFRLDKRIEEIAKECCGIDIAYIDTTYSNEFYSFISQESAIIEILDIIKKNCGKKIYIGLYSLGKNKIIKAIFEHLRLKIYVDAFNANIFKIIGLEKTIATAHQNNIIYGVDLRTLWRKMETKQEEPNSIYIIPTGRVQSNRVVRNVFYLVPYSEHCDYHELRRFISILRPKEFYPLHYFKGLEYII
ncbi:MAG: hypothetical protein ACK4NF_06580 [Planctomycetota bacterium]